MAPPRSCGAWVGGLQPMPHIYAHSQGYCLHDWGLQSLGLLFLSRSLVEVQGGTRVGCLFIGRPRILCPFSQRAQIPVGCVINRGAISSGSLLWAHPTLPSYFKHKVCPPVSLSQKYSIQSEINYFFVYSICPFPSFLLLAWLMRAFEVKIPGLSFIWEPKMHTSHTLRGSHSNLRRRKAISVRWYDTYWNSKVKR